MMTKKPTTNESNSLDAAVKNLGLLYTSYVEKQNPVSGAYKRRFLVLTHEALHWFNRRESEDLLGEERGQIPLGSILAVRILDKDSTIFEIESVDGKKKLFRCNSTTVSEEWVSGIRSAIKRLSASAPTRRPRRHSISNLRAIFEDNDEVVDMQAVEVTISLVALRSARVGGGEVVLARNPQWGRVVLLQNVKPTDQLVISTSNGGTIVLSAGKLVELLQDGGAAECPVQDVPLASSVKLSVLSAAPSPSAQVSLQLDGSKTTRLAFLLSQLLMSSRQQTGTVVLALMFSVVSLSSLPYITETTSLLFLLSWLMALHSVYFIFRDVAAPVSGASTNSTNNFRLILHSHAFTSPDAPVNDPEDEIPQRFIIGCEYDMKEARRRWDITRHWREAEGINGILQEKQPNFFTIKEWYPHYHAGRGKLGHVVFYDRPGELNSAQLIARGINVEKLVRHFLYVTEFQWQKLCQGDETAKSIAVIDITGVGMADLAGDALEYLKKTVSIANAHYPERSYVIFVVNAPVWFSLLWRIVKPLVHENTQKKIRILSRSATLAGLQEHIDIDQIPEYYGGRLDFGGHDSCRFQSPETLAINEYTNKLNKRDEVSNNKPFSTDSDGAGPPGKPGDQPEASDLSGSTSAASKERPVVRTSTSLSDEDRRTIQSPPPLPVSTHLKRSSVAPAAAVSPLTPDTVFRPQPVPPRATLVRKYNQ